MISSDMRIAHCTVLFWRLGRHFVYTPRLSTGHSCWIVFVLYPSTIRIVQVKITNSRRHAYLKAHQFQSAASASRHERWPTMTLKPSDPLFSPSASRSFTSFSLMGEWAKVGINPHFRYIVISKHLLDSDPCSEASLRNGRIFKGPKHVDQNTRAVQTGETLYFYTFLQCFLPLWIFNVQI